MGITYKYNLVQSCTQGLHGHALPNGSMPRRPAPVYTYFMTLALRYGAQAYLVKKHTSADALDR